jgi:UDP-glucose:glycoprotein glucosyltransferase
MKVYNMTIHDTTNTTRGDVFSIASGHLYERLMKIMMLSVRRNSQFAVKFWIINNFLSPQFKASLPKLALRYNFSYQLISYKWPLWLHPQFEKQRILWGNKILFLDLLFPLNLDRVIYVDSDQIVRTDLIELMRMNFEKDPFADTAFCDSRPETNPFRFWRAGWLLQKPGTWRIPKAHISALFAINLHRFRELVIGDGLRYYYDALSQDPARLAQFDRDLANYPQDVISIYSLPQDGLWCETWCRDESFLFASTWGLCEYPLTLRRKLSFLNVLLSKLRSRQWFGDD